MVEIIFGRNFLTANILDKLSNKILKVAPANSNGCLISNP